jgi:tetratricopeptide (TPR) repeat protein
MWGMVAAALFVSTSPVPASAAWVQEKNLSNEEVITEEAAVNAQNSGEFRDAIRSWKKLLDDYPKTALRPSALLNLGLCEVQTKDFSSAAGHLRDAIPLTDPAKIEALAKAHFYLGYSHWQLGNAALDTDDQTQVNQNFTTAATVLKKVLDEFPNFKGLDEAAYFRATALEKLGQIDEAIPVYKRVLDFEDSKFLHDALFALGDLYVRKEEDAAATAYLLEFLETGRELPAANDVRLLAGEALWRQAQKVRERDADAFKKLADDAAALWQAVSDDRNFSRHTDATFNLAMLKYSIGDRPAAIEAFRAVAAVDQSNLKYLAAMNLGRLLMGGESADEGIAALRKVVAADVSQSAEAAHWLCRALIAADHPDEAFEVAKQWSERCEDAEQKSMLLVDQADAALELPERVSEATALFEQAYALDQTNAPIALYNASFAALRNQAFEQALALAQKFEQRFVAHDFTPDVLEVRAESLLGLERPTEAVATFDSLLKDHPQHPKRSYWLIRDAAAKFLSGDYQSVEALLANSVEGIEDAKQQAEAWHWIGLARVKLDQSGPAIEAFEKSIAAGTWPRQSETLLALVRAQLQSDRVEDAVQIVTRLEKDFPDSPQTPEALYALASQYDKAGEGEKSASIFERVATMKNAGAFSKYALLNKGYASFDRGDMDAARADFEATLAQAGDDRSLKNKARLGLASIARKSGDFASAEKQLRDVLDESESPATEVDARYELGLVHVAGKKWSDAIQEFQTLLGKPEASGIEPNVRYELAWAFMRSEETDLANEQFRLLTEKFADTTFGADAQFQLGEAEYAAKQYDTAIGHYSQAAEGAPDALREKALYKWGWALFRQEKFDEARTVFERQAAAFENGPLVADARYMIAEASFKQQKFAEAFEAFTVARPVMESSKSIERENVWLGKLHAAQSANKIKKFQEAWEIAESLARDESVNQLLRYDAWLEAGIAAFELGDREAATQAWKEASAEMGATGARSRYQLGAVHFTNQKFDDAIQEFTLVKNGYGGDAESPEVDPWQALASYEIGRCLFEQSKLVAADQGERRQQLLEESRDAFESLIRKYPSDALVSDAKKQIEKLDQLISKKE